MSHPNRRTPGLALAAALAASLVPAVPLQARFQGPGVYKIKFAQTNQVLDIDSRWPGSTDAGRALLRWGDNKGQNQQFIVFAAHEGGYVIRPLHSLKCLDVPHNLPATGVGIVQYDCHYGENQRFEISSDATTTFIRTVNGRFVLNGKGEGGAVELASPASGPEVGMLFEFDPL